MTLNFVLLLRLAIVFGGATFVGYRSQKDGWILVAGPLFLGAKLVWFITTAILGINFLFFGATEVAPLLLAYVFLSEIVFGWVLGSKLADNFH